MGPRCYKLFSASSVAGRLLEFLTALRGIQPQRGLAKLDLVAGLERPAVGYLVAIDIDRIALAAVLDAKLAILCRNPGMTFAMDGVVAERQTDPVLVTATDRVVA